MEEVHDRCDKCGEPVPITNDAVALDRIITGSPLLLFSQPRHLLPTDTCEGSPSRAQYIKGQPRDPRPEYPYQERLELIVRIAYRSLTAINN